MVALSPSVTISFKLGLVSTFLRYAKPRFCLEFECNRIQSIH